MGADNVSTAPPAATPDVVIGLDAAGGDDPGVVGAKAAALARARRAGLPVLDGFAITTAAAAAIAEGTASGRAMALLSAAWRELSAAGTRALVVRSSTVSEDGESSSMAGRFTSVLDVRGWESFLVAIGAVVESAGGEPIGVLVQPFLEPAWGGVMFGADPVTGRSDRIVVSAVSGGPDRLVSGQVDGVQFTLSPHGRLGEHTDRLPSGLRQRRRHLARLARQAAAVFGSPQDVEWAIDVDGQPVLLQSRPITALGADAKADGPVLGPGPVAETFGAPLRPLEEDLWVTPLRDGLREALRVVGTTPARKLRDSPIVVVVDGWVAADLDVLGVAKRRRSLLARLDPRPPARRLKAAWRVGRLKVALPVLADDLLDEVDDDLMSLPHPETLEPADLVHLLRRSHQTLMALHGHEVLAGMLLGEDGAPTAAAIALRILHAERGPAAGVMPSTTAATDDELVARHPVLLTLVPPGIGVGIQLPPPPASPPPAPPDGGGASVRESLRLRIRWVHEVTARAAISLGAELVRRGALASAADVVNVKLDELAALVEAGGTLAVELRATAPEDTVGTPLPAAFRLTDDRVVVPVSSAVRAGGRGAGGGRGTGPVHVGTDEPPSPGDVLVVRTLDPGLAGVLPTLGGLVAETGSVLSHLAILAREYGVPTVVGLAGAADRFADGTWVLIDGSTGEVSPVDDAEWRAA
jgi:rifampicin phosphotransferase